MLPLFRVILILQLVTFANMLTAADAAVPRETPPNSQTPLHLAVLAGDAVKVAELIERGADVNARNRKNATPLHIAAAMGHLSVAKLLLSKGADTNAVDLDGKTPLIRAGEQSNKDIMEILRAYGHGERIVPENEFRKPMEELTREMLSLYADRKFEESIRAGDQALQVCATGFGKTSAIYADVLQYLSVSCSAIDQNARAELLLREAITIYEKAEGPDSLDMARANNALAVVYIKLGRYGLAQNLLMLGLKIRTSKLGPNQPEIAQSLGNLGVVSLKLGNLTKAIDYTERSISIRLINAAGKPDLNLDSDRSNLAVMYGQAGELTAAEHILLEILKTHPLDNPRDHVFAMGTMNSLGALYVQMHEYEKAEKLLSECLAALEKEFGAEHIELIDVLPNLGQLYIHTGRISLADKCYERVLSILRKSFNVEHPQMVKALHQLAIIKMRNMNFIGGAELETQSRRSNRAYELTILPTLSSEDQIISSNERSSVDDVTYSMAFYATSELASISAEWVLNAKACVHEVLAARAVFEHAEGVGPSSDLARQISVVRHQLAASVLSGTNGDHLPELKLREAQLSDDLGRLMGAHGQQESYITLNALRKTLPNNSVFITIVRFKKTDFNAVNVLNKLKPEDHYGAWIVFPDAQMRNAEMVDLGKAAQIDEAIEVFRNETMAERSTKVQEKLGIVSKLILSPLESAIGRYEKWLISPDGALWLIPWVALPLADGTLCVEKHTISYLISGRELVNPGYHVETTSPVIIADPDFDLGLAKARLPTEQQSLLMTRSAGLKGEIFNRLKGTEREANAIRGPLAAYTKAEPIVWIGADANKTKFFRLHSPKVLVMSTHGFFLAEEKTADPRTDTSRHRLGSENPLLRCGLILAGANNRESVPAGGDDGILSGLEIAGSDLRGTDLVVLSACDTGVGAVNNGEGVAGIRQCFQFAGAKGVVTTLWQIPDTASAVLMTDFFTHLSVGQPKADALRNAQLEMIARLKKEGIAPHPFFWAAFTLTGQWK